MALNKVITTDLGVALNYHNIKSIEVDNDTVIVILNSYASEDMRLKEKNNQKTLKEYKDTKSELEKESEKPIELRDDVKIKDLSERLVKLNRPDLHNSYIAGTQSVTLPLNKAEDISLANIYSILKETSKFEGSNNI